MKKVVLSLLSVLLAFQISACGQKAPTWQEQYDLGVHYLSEGSYEEAIIAFTAAIEIDPKMPEAYLDLAYAYIGQGDYDAAVEILTRGYELTQDSRLKDKLDEIESGNITDYWGNFRKMSSYDETGALVWYHLYDYAPDGTQTSATSYDAVGNQTGHVDLVYGENGERLTGYHWSNHDGTIGRIVSEYESGNPIKETFYSEDEQILSYNLNKFDQRGNLVRFEQYEPDGTLSYYRINEYNNDGNVIKESDYDSDGSLIGYCDYKYDSNGMIAREDWYNEDGALEEFKIFRYDSDGNQIGEDTYDGQGNLISSTVKEN